MLRLTVNFVPRVRNLIILIKLEEIYIYICETMSLINFCIQVISIVHRGIHHENQFTRARLFLQM